MQGLLILVFAKRQHLLHIREVESEYTRTGLGGIWVTNSFVINLIVYNSYTRCKNSFMHRETKVLLAFALIYMVVRFVL